MGAHQWSWVGTYWQCAECLRSKRGMPSTQPPAGKCDAVLKIHLPGSVRSDTCARCSIALTGPSFVFATSVGT
eukprot:2623325-Pyramimonas_sp.AAC.1